MKNYLKILFDSRYIFFINFIEKIVFFVFFLILARELDKSAYGLITTAFAFTNILNSFFDLGLSYYFQREAEQENISELISNAFTSKVIGSLLFFSVLLGYLYFYLHLDIKIVCVVGGLTYLHSFNSIMISYLYGKKEYKRSFQSFLISRVGFIILIALMLVMKITGYYIILTLLISVLFQFGILIKYVFLNGLVIKPALNKEILIKIVKSSLPIGLGGIFVFLYDKVDVLLIERFINLESVAVYAIAYSVYKLFHIFSSIILTSVYTDFSKSFSDKEGIRYIEIKSILILLLFFSLLFILFINLFGDKVVVLIFSSKYYDSVKYLNFLILALPALYLNNFTGVISNSIRKEKIPMYITGMGAFVNIVSNLIMIYKFGIWGAVIATILTEYIVFIFQAVLLFRQNQKRRFVLE